MKIAIMQPYFFPYLGYFHLINAVDLFVFYDDVNFIKKGWVNRNRLLNSGSTVSYITVPCKEQSQNKKINEINTALDQRNLYKLISRIESTYKKAPFFKEVFEIFTDVLSSKAINISELAISSIERTCLYLGTEKQFIKSSRINDDKTLGKEERLISICKLFNADTYINPIGGIELYNKMDFAAQGITLYFLKPILQPYKQFDDKTFFSGLSILDILMFNSKEEVIQNHLTKYELL